VKPTGPHSYYRPKDPTPVSVNLTPEGKLRLAEIQTRTGASRSDVVEQLLRRFGRHVKFRGEK
jgi:hypothetical protein